MVSDACFAAGGGEHCFDLLCKDSFTSQSRVESRVIQFAATNRADSIQNLFLSIGKMMCQPLFKEILDGMRQAEDGIPRVLRPSLHGSFNDRGNFMIVKTSCLSLGAMPE